MVFEYAKEKLECSKCGKLDGGWRNLVPSLISSIVQKGHKEIPDQVNGDYSGSLIKPWSENHLKSGIPKINTV